MRADGLYEAKLGKNVSVQAFSPDGRWLAVLREVNSGEEDQVTRIEIVPVGFTAERRRLGLGTEVSFSTDGRRLGFIDEKSGVIDLRTGRRMVLLHQFPLGLQWSPNMTGLIIQRENEELRNGDLLYFRAASGAKARVISSGPLPLAVAWLDEHRVGYDVTIRGVTTLMVRRVDGEGRRVIAQGKLPFHHWAPDGKSVAYSIRDGHAVTIASTSTSARRTISLGSGQLRNMTWLSSGRRLALFVSGAKGELVIGEPVAARSSDGSDLLLTRAGAGHPMSRHSPCQPPPPSSSFRSRKGASGSSGVAGTPLLSGGCLAANRAALHRRPLLLSRK